MNAVAVESEKPRSSNESDERKRGEKEEEHQEGREIAGDIEDQEGRKEQEDEQTRLKTTIFQRTFIGQIYIIATTFFLIALIESFFLAHVGRVYFSRVDKYMGQLFIWFTFMSLLSFMFFFNYIRNRSLILTWSCAIITAEMETIVITQPLSYAIHIDVVYSLAFLGLLTAVILPLSFQLYKDIKYTFKFLKLWTGRFFLISAMGILMTKTLRETWIEISFASLTILPIIFFNVQFAKALGSEDLCAENRLKVILVGILLYFNFAAIFSNALVFLTAARKLL